MRIVYFDLDCVRADHLGVYGYHRETTPVMDELSGISAVFENCFTSDAPCLPSRAALFSCRPGISNGVVSHEFAGCHFRFPAAAGLGQYYGEYTMPMRLLQQNGYHTVTFSTFPQRHCAWWFNAGFSEVINPTYPNKHENSNQVNPRVVKWIRKNIHDHPDVFLHIHYMDAHTPYRPDEECRARVSKHSLALFPDEELIKDHYENFYGPKSARDLMIRWPGYKSPDPRYMPDEIGNREALKTMMDSYDGAIATVDRAIGEIIHVLKEENAYENTVIIISGDHGEAIGQMGMYFEHGVAVDGVARVPLIFHWPGLTDKGVRCNELIYQYDFMATLMELLSINRPEAWDALPFNSLFSGAGFPGRPYIVYGCGIFTLQRTVRTKKYAYVRTLHPGCYPLEDAYLFDIVRDPEQSRNIRSEFPEQVGEMEKLLSDWWHSWCSGPNAVVDPMHEQIHSFEYFSRDVMLKRLEFVHRPDQAEDLNRRLEVVRRISRQRFASDSRF